jgi:hypothetical protein
MFKERSKIFFFTVLVECFVAFAFLLFSSMGTLFSETTKDALTVGTLYSLTGIQTIGILVVVSAVLNFVGIIYNNKEIITMGTVLVIASLVTDFFGSTLLVAFQNTCDETVFFGTILSLLLNLIVIVILMIGFEDQLKMMKKNTKKSK